MPRALLDEVHSLQEQMGNISREKKSKERTKEGTLEVVNTGTKMKNTFDGFTSRHD